MIIYVSIYLMQVLKILSNLRTKFLKGIKDKQYHKNYTDMNEQNRIEYTVIIDEIL